MMLGPFITVHRDVQGASELQYLIPSVLLYTGLIQSRHLTPRRPF